MKKEYIAPNTTIVAVEQHLLDATSTLSISGSNAEVIISESDYDGEFCSRRGGFFDDEE